MSSESKKSPKFLKAGKIVLLLSGRMAGKKAVIVKTFDEGTPDRPYGHCIVAGIQKFPLKITKKMSEKKIAKRSRSLTVVAFALLLSANRRASQIKPFIKCVNYNHLMPTRYMIDLELKSLVTTDIVAGSNPTARSNCRKDVKKLLEDKCVPSFLTRFFCVDSLYDTVTLFATPSRRIDYLRRNAAHTLLSCSDFLGKPKTPRRLLYGVSNGWSRAKILKSADVLRKLVITTLLFFGAMPGRPLPKCASGCVELPGKRLSQLTDLCLGRSHAAVLHQCCPLVDGSLVATANL
eukprot:2583494-Pleurochrysis_carterae.AAC.3